MKSGIALVGSTIVDTVLSAQEPGRLTYVDAEKFVSEQELSGEKAKYSVGGMALNVAVDLAKIGGNYPIAVFGKIGADANADIIRSALRENRIDPSTLLIDDTHETSGTEVIHIRMPDGNVERIFRHTLGAMGAFREQDISIEDLTPFKIAMFGYGLLLPQLDLADEQYGVILGRVLARAQSQGILTALDFVSPDEDNKFKFLRYRKALKYVDILCINDDQACSLAEVDNPRYATESLVQDHGVNIAVVHCGALGPNYAFSQQEGLVTQANFTVAPEDCKGNAGAGDAFSAGFLHGIHQSWSVAESVRFAAAAAAVSLGDESCTGAMRDESFILQFMQ